MTDKNAELLTQEQIEDARTSHIERRRWLRKDEINALCDMAIRALATTQQDATSKAEGMPEEPQVFSVLKQGTHGGIISREMVLKIDYDTLRACAMRWKADGDMLDFLEHSFHVDGTGDEAVYCVFVPMFGGQHKTMRAAVRAAIDAEIAKERG